MKLFSKKLLLTTTFALLSLIAKAQVRIVSVSDDGNLQMHRVDSASKADCLSFFTEGRISERREQKKLQVRFLTGGKAEIIERHRYRNHITNLKTGKWGAIDGGYKAVVKDNSGREYQLFLDITHNSSYFTLFDPNAAYNFSHNNTNKSQPVFKLAFYRQTPYDYEDSDLCVYINGAVTPVKSLSKNELDNMCEDPSFKKRIFKRTIPIVTESKLRNNSISDFNNKSIQFNISINGIYDEYRISYADYDLTQIVNKFKSKEKLCEMVLFTKVETEMGFSLLTSKMISAKLDSIRCSFDKREAKCKRFIATAKLDTTSIETDNLRGTSFNGRLSLYVLDTWTKKVFSRCYVYISAEGENVEQAKEKALLQIDWNEHRIRDFMQKGLKGIGDFYNNFFQESFTEVANKIIPFGTIGNEEKDSHYEAMEKHFDAAVQYLLSTPADHAAYGLSIKYAAFLSFLKAEYHYRYLLRKANNLARWSQKQAENDKSNNQALQLLNKIPKESIFYKESRTVYSTAKNNLMTADEHNKKLAEEGVKMHNQMLYKNKDYREPSKHSVGANTASGIFTLGIMMAAFALVTPVTAPATPIILLII